MKYLFLLAHPDDEAVAAGGTIRRLADQGDEVRVVLATDGGGSEKAGAETRRKELKNSCRILGVKSVKILKFKDGEINNKLVWGPLESAFIEEIEEFKPEVVISFDHSGWYFHLDHVGVSLAALRAVQRSKHKTDIFWFSLFQPPGMKLRWQYVYPKKLTVTHEVEIGSVVKEKIKAIKAHRSQKIPVRIWQVGGGLKKEQFQLVLATRKGKCWLKKSQIFSQVET